MTRQPRVGVSAVLIEAGQTLIVKRGKDPMRGRWAFPGGTVDWGERLEDAAQREVLEETGLNCEILGLVEIIDAIGAPQADGKPETHFVIAVFAAQMVSGNLVAGDDAAEAHFVKIGTLPAAESVPRLQELATKARKLYFSGV